MKNIFLGSLLLLVGCATSTTHVGTHWGHSQGPVSTSDAEKASKFVESFHDNLKNKKWNEVYNVLDKKVQSKISSTDLEKIFAKLDFNHGVEQSFKAAKNPPAEILAGISQGFDEGKSSDGFLYYDAILSRHLSSRKKNNLIYIVGVTRPEKNADLKINSLQVYAEKDGSELKLKNPVLQLSSSYSQLIK